MSFYPKTWTYRMISFRWRIRCFFILHPQLTTGNNCYFVALLQQYLKKLLYRNLKELTNYHDREEILNAEICLFNKLQLLISLFFHSTLTHFQPMFHFYPLKGSENIVLIFSRGIEVGPSLVDNGLSFNKSLR